MQPQDSGQPGSSAMRWWGWLLCLIMFAGVTVSLTLSSGTHSVTQRSTVPFTFTTTSPQGIDPSVIQVSVDALFNAYNNSIPKARAMYEGQTLRVSGILAAVGEENGRFYADLLPSSNPLASDSMRFYFLNEDVYRLAASATAGQRIAITGLCRIDTAITFENCSLVYIPQE